MVENKKLKELDVFERGNDSRKHNNNIKASRGIIVYCRENYAQELYDKYENSGVYDIASKTGKDLVEGEVYTCIIESVNEKEALASTKTGQTVFIDIKDEYKKAIKLGIEGLVFEKNIDVNLVVKKMRDSFSGSYIDFHEKNVRIELYEQIEKQSSAYLAKIESINNGGYIADVSGVKCFLPGSLAAANKITDFDSYVGRKIYVMIDSYIRERDMFVISYKKYLENIIDQKIDELDKTTKYSGTVTGVSKFGVFVEWDEFYTGLIHKSEIEKEESKDSFKSGDSVEFYVKDIRENNRVTLSLSKPTEKAVKLEEVAEKMESGEPDIVEALIKNVRKKGLLIYIESLGSMGFVPKEKLNSEDLKLREGDKIEVIIYEIDTRTGKIFAMSAYE